MPMDPTAFKHAMAIDRLAMLWLYPRLKELPPALWGPTLAKARSGDFETMEWVGIVVGVALVAWMLGIEIPALAAQPVAVLYLARFGLALPLLSIIVGPLYLRRTRRGLDRELAGRMSHSRDAAGLPCRKEP
jgi:hypothetical protein